MGPSGNTASFGPGRARGTHTTGDRGVAESGEGTRERPPGDDLGMSVTEIEEVRERQEDVMEVESADGRPPTYEHRMMGWRWLGVALSALVIVGLVLALAKGVSVGGAIGYGVLVLLVMFAAGLPVWVASVNRGKEEAIARRVATIELHPEHAEKEREEVERMRGENR